MFRSLTFTVFVLCSMSAAAQDPALELEGTTIIGDRELPIGLYISPWRSAMPESDIDRPSRYLDVDSDPVDPEAFRRQIEYYEALRAYSSSLQNNQ